MEGRLSMKSVKLPFFDCKHQNYQKCWLGFKAYAAIIGFSQALGDMEEFNLPACKATAINPADINGTAAKKRNQVTCASLSMALETNTQLGISMKAMTMD